ncbi:hypothetical protein VC279_20675 [Xanthomonas sp. WHRI 10064A]|uniref:hypothetical protein n=1 Tax=unclassified Xanthomonas TaxID=2643310 RepID=UPI002B228A0A|nr:MULTISPECIES: hypothetical protein [unclassified Xanthomonas]MEA9589631.1 hypothetical protein [Xanthomonas sp. WHRI 10064B]MEA9617018.1 hypothetical protein [Xanthomonas sp. WHRI 10064A]
MSGISEKIYERYADELGKLPSIGTLTAFLIVAAVAYLIERNGLSWPPTADLVFSENLSTLFDTEKGIISSTSVGAIMISIGITASMKGAYELGVKKIFSLIYKTGVITQFVRSASEIANKTGVSQNPNDSCTTLVSEELSSQRKIFQRLHGAAFVAFIVAALCVFNILHPANLIIFICSSFLLLSIQYLAIKLYLTKLFPALCVVWSTQGRTPAFGQS